MIFLPAFVLFFLASLILIQDWEKRSRKKRELKIQATLVKDKCHSRMGKRRNQLTGQKGPGWYEKQMHQKKIKDFFFLLQSHPELGKRQYPRISAYQFHKKKNLLEHSTNSVLVEKLICFELNVESECQGKVTSKEESPSLGKMSKGHADIYIFFSLSTLLLNKNLPKPTGCLFLMEIYFDKIFPTSFTSSAQTFPLSIPIWIWKGGGGKDEEG